MGCLMAETKAADAGAVADAVNRGLRREALHQAGQHRPGADLDEHVKAVGDKPLDGFFPADGMVNLRGEICLDVRPPPFHNPPSDWRRRGWRHRQWRCRPGSAPSSPRRGTSGANGTPRRRSAGGRASPRSLWQSPRPRRRLRRPGNDDLPAAVEVRGVHDARPTLLRLAAGGGDIRRRQSQDGGHRARDAPASRGASPGRDARPACRPVGKSNAPAANRAAYSPTEWPATASGGGAPGFAQGAQGGHGSDVQRRLRVDRLAQRVFRAVKTERAHLGAEVLVRLVEDGTRGVGVGAQIRPHADGLRPLSRKKIGDFGHDVSLAPADHVRAPGQARAEADQDDQIAAPDAARLDGLVQGQGDGGGATCCRSGPG